MTFWDPADPVFDPLDPHPLELLGDFETWARVCPRDYVIERMAIVLLQERQAVERDLASSLKPALSIIEAMPELQKMFNRWTDQCKSRTFVSNVPLMSPLGQPYVLMRPRKLQANISTYDHTIKAGNTIAFNIGGPGFDEAGLTMIPTAKKCILFISNLALEQNILQGTLYTGISYSCETQFPFFIPACVQKGEDPLTRLEYWAKNYNVSLRTAEIPEKHMPALFETLRRLMRDQDVTWNMLEREVPIPQNNALLRQFKFYALTWGFDKGIKGRSVS